MNDTADQPVPSSSNNEGTHLHEAASALPTLREVEQTVHAMLCGEKPWVDPRNVQTGWLLEQLTRMRAGFLLPEEPKCYVTESTDTISTVPLKGNTSLHPVGYPLTKSAQAVRKVLNDEQMFNHVILGFNHAYRDPAANPLDLLDGDPAVILTKSDLMGLHQMLALLAHRVETGDTTSPVFINNHRGLWDPFLHFCRDLGLDLGALNVHRADNYVGLIDGVRHLTPQPRVEPAHKPSVLVKPGATILVQTSNDKKIHELKAILDFQGIDAQVLPFNLLVERPIEAKELSRTYAGNCDEKRESAVEKTDSVSREEIISRLGAYGADPANTYIFLDDRGLDTALKLAGTEEFACCSNYLSEYRAAPGVELGNVLKSMSLTNFYLCLKAVAERAGDTVDLSSQDITCYMMTPLFPNEQGERPVYTSFGATRDIIGFDPRPASDAHYYSEHYLIPEGESRGRTKAEIPNYIESKSSMARAAMALAAITGVDRHANQMVLSHEAQKVFQVSPAHQWAGYNVHTQTSFFSSVYGHGDRYVTKKLRERYQLRSGRDGRYDYTAATAFRMGTKNGHGQIVHSRLNAFQTYLEEGDAFLLGPFPGKYKDMAELDVHKLFIFTSLVVGKQVFDPAVYPKLFGVYGREWDECIALYDDFHRMGLIGQKPQHVFAQIRDTNKRGIVREINETLDQHFRSYRRLDYPQPNYVEKGKAEDGLFRVTIYCSATSTDQFLQKDAFDLSYRLAALGYCIKNGGGTEGLMRQTSDGVHALRKDVADYGTAHVPVNSIISDQYEYTMRAEGLYDRNDLVRVHPSIFSRLEALQDTDAEIVLAGGAGTIQEIMASLITRMSHARPVANRPLVIVNQKVAGNGVRRGVYDNLLRYIPADIIKQNNMHVVDTIEEATEIVNKARRSMGMNPRHISIANDSGRQVLPQGMPLRIVL